LDKDNLIKKKTADLGCFLFNLLKPVLKPGEMYFISHQTKEKIT